MPLKSLWEYSALIRPKILMFPLTFWVPGCSAVGFSTTVAYGRPLKLELLKKRTDARHSVSSQVVKYNIIGATIFMTFRTQIHKKKFDKNGFHTLQGTMSHRPLTNASSLKITAAYYTCIYTVYKNKFYINALDILSCLKSGTR